MAKVLVLFAHPALENSRVNRELLAVARSVEGLTVHDLYEAYPDFHIDVPAEQARLEAHGALVLQHPLFWYSAPSLVKEWLDLVLEWGWAYGTDGDALQGKAWLQALTAGGGVETYCPSGYNNFSIRELLTPFEQTANLCGMRYLPPFAVFGANRLSSEAIALHASAYREVLTRLRDDRPLWDGETPTVLGLNAASCPPSRVHA